MDLDLNTLPAPTVVEEIAYEAILTTLRADLLARHPAVAEVIDLESEPLLKLLQAHAYREMLFRQRVNEAARAHLLAFAVGTDLDHKGAFYGIARLAGETDARYRVRIQLRIASLAANGTAEQYRLVAMTASANVRDAAVNRPVPGAVNVVLWLADAGQAGSTTAAAHAALNAEGARPLGIPITVSLAQAKVVNLKAQIWREPTAPANLVAQIAAELPGRFADFARLGRALSRSWVTTRLHVPGVVRVVYPDAGAPPDNTPMAADQYPVLGTVELQDMGTA